MDNQIGRFWFNKIDRIFVSLKDDAWYYPHLSDKAIINPDAL